MRKKERGVYCGNNAKSKKLTIEKFKIGKPYQCLRKGIGVGLNLPLNTDMVGPYKPLRKRSFFCGKKANIDKDKYDRMGDPTECLRAGIVIGQKKKADEFFRTRIKKKSKSKSRKRRSKKKSKKKRSKSGSKKKSRPKKRSKSRSKSKRVRKSRRKRKSRK